VTQKEAEQIATVLVTAHSFCTHCAEDLAKQMAAVFPQFPWLKLVRLEMGHKEIRS
jgi:hypothetical protein